MTCVPILLYHSVDDDPVADVARWSVTMRTFREHMRVLRTGGWSTFTMSELARRLLTSEELPERSLAITFDDGYADALTRALPVMSGLTATVYMTSGYLDDWAEPSVAAPGRMLSGVQLGQLYDAGWEVGVHGHRHVALDAVNRPTAWAEIVGSKEIIEDALGRRTASFAYPYGYHSTAVQRMVAQAGFDHAVGVKNAFTHGEDDSWAMARITVERSTTAAQLARTLLQAPPPVARSRERLSTVGWRTARRLRSAVTGTS